MATQVAAGTAAAYLPRSAADAIFGERIPIFAGVGAPRGRADPVPGGYRLSGDWSYGSGILHAEFIHTGVMIFENGAPRKLPGSQALDSRIFIIPVSDARLLGNWDVMGLRATGSVDYEVKDVFVAEDWTHLQSQREPRQGGSVYRLGIQGLGGICHSGFALGTARRALDELAALARAETGRPQLLPERGGGESFREKFGHAEAQFRAARAFVVEALRDVEASLAKGNDISVRQFTLMRLALNHVTSVAGEVCAFTFKYGGGIALRDSVLQRCFRDMCAGMQHITTGPGILRECGLELLGVTQGKIWGPRGLIDPP
jgi:alkylation response protein AidB-like acyl-CoA dehydrogenase